MTFFYEDLVLPVAVMLGLLIAGAAGIGLLNKVAAQSYQVQLAEYRTAVERLGCQASEDVIGTAAAANKRIASARYWNAVPLVSLWVPNEIADAQPIEIPACR